MTLFSGRNNLIKALKDFSSTKEDRRNIVTGKLGFRDSNGDRIIKVPNRPQFVYVRIHGLDSEVVEAFNDQVYLKYDVPVQLIIDPLAPRYYKVIGRDVGKYDDWQGAGVASHGEQHSFNSNSTDGLDVVFVYKRQIVQPMLCRPQQPTRNMTVYVEADYYFWNNNYVRFAGGSSEDLTAYKPSTPGMGKFVLIYIEPNTNTVKILVGTEFSVIFIPSAGVLASIPTLNPSLGLPIAAVLLTSTTTAINWADIWDLRTLITTPTSGSTPGIHGLDPADGHYHTGQLNAYNVNVADADNYFTGVTAEQVFAEVGNTLLNTVKARNTGIYFNAPASINFFTPEANARILRTEIRVNTLFNASTATLRIGVSGDTERYARDSDSWLGTGAIFETHPMFKETTALPILVGFATSGGGTQGQADITLEYTNNG